MRMIDTEELAKRMDAWRAERDGVTASQPARRGEDRRLWLSHAGKRARRLGLRPVPGRRSGRGQSLWDAREVERVLRVPWQSIAREAISNAREGVAAADVLAVLLARGIRIHQGTLCAWLRGLLARGEVRRWREGGVWVYRQVGR